MLCIYRWSYSVLKGASVTHSLVFEIVFAEFTATLCGGGLCPTSPLACVPTSYDAINTWSASYDV